MSSITEFGFERDDYLTILENVKQRFRDELGNEVGLEDDKVLGQLAALIAKLQNDNVKLLEALWGSHKIDAAEGIYLDDILGRMGVFRKGKQKGTGLVYFEIDNTAPNNYILPITTSIQGVSGKNYFPQEAYLLSDRIRAYTLTTAQLSSGQLYQVTLTSTVDQTQKSFSYSPADESDKLAMLGSLAAFWRSHMPGNNSRIFVNGTTLYVGYDIGLNLIGLTEQTQFSITPLVGNRFSAVPVIAEEAGYFPLAPDSISGITPEFTGYVSAKNILAFYAGSEVETDSEYKLRYFKEINKTKTGTRESIVSAVIALDGVDKVKIYDNASLNNRTEANAKTFHLITVGGVTSEISQAVYDNKPINTNTTGSISYSVPTSDGETETIRHSKATQIPVNVKIKYSTDTGNPLSDFNKDEINKSLVDCVDQLNIGDTIYNTRLVFCVLSSSGASSLISSIVEIKLDSEANSAYRSTNIVPLYNQIYTLDINDISYTQVI